MHFGRQLTGMLAVVVIAATPWLAHAGSWENIDHRIHEMSERIDVEQRNGSMTPWEANKLRARLWNVRQSQRAFMSKGWMDGNEYWQLEHQLDMVGENIQPGHHDRSGRPGGWWEHGHREHHSRDHWWQGD